MAGGYADRRERVDARRGAGDGGGGPEARKDGDYRLFERRYGRFQRSFTVPPAVKTDACSASYENGVLRLRLPKAEEAKPRRIRIGSNGDAGRDVG